MQKDREMKRHITHAGNTLVPAYLEIRRRGFEVRRDRSIPNCETWYAEKEQTKFSSDDPVSLLGLVAMVESRGEDWQACDEEVNEFMRAFDYE